MYPSEEAHWIVEREANRLEALEALGHARQGEFEMLPDSGTSEPSKTLDILFQHLERFRLEPEEIDTTYTELVELVGKEQAWLLASGQREPRLGGPEAIAHFRAYDAKCVLGKRVRFFRERERIKRKTETG